MYISPDGNIALEYVLSGNHPNSSDDSKTYTNLDEITIFNNEEFIIDLTDVKILKFDKESPIDEDYVEPHKIIVDWGDGKTDTSVAKITNSLSTINSNSEWKKISHNYAFEEYTEKSAVKITCFNIFGTSFTFNLPFSVVYKSLSDIGTEFKIISANIRNDGETSYVLKHIATDSIVFVVSNEN